MFVFIMLGISIDSVMLLGLGLIRDDTEKQTKDSVQLYTFIYTEAARSHYGLQKYTVNQHFWGYV